MPFLLSDEEWGITPEIRANGALMPDKDRQAIRDAINKLVIDYLEAYWKWYREKHG